MPETFTSFMARSLHDPQRGYYARHVQAIGVKGDFSTSATLSPLLGQAIAHWLKAESKTMPEVRHIIEVGAGSGQLMQTIRQSLGWWNRRRFQWHIVETSGGLRDQQRLRLGNAVQWHTDLASALRAIGGKAFIYHNELLDAFPVILLQWQDNQWQEVHVELHGSQAQESLMPHTLTEAECMDFAIFDQPPTSPKQRVELHLSVRDWLQSWAPAWQAGSMLTVDYGDEFPALYHRRPRGTLRAYLLHQRLDGPALYHNIGRQDITADINFTDYRKWTQTLGWEECAFQNQASFIASRTQLTSNQLMDSDGAGGAFKVVAHRKLCK
jgi:SAM-dependent MidA family methyltransferase